MLLNQLTFLFLVLKEYYFDKQPQLERPDNIGLPPGLQLNFLLLYCKGEQHDRF